MHSSSRSREARPGSMLEKEQLQLLNQVRPRVHCLTNPVTMQGVANMLLAAGGSAIMAQDPEEVQDIAALCQAVLLNTGVPDREKFRACVLAGERANELGIPVILDPVGAGASPFRLQELEQLAKKVRLSLIRCNQEEAKALLHIWNGRSKGVESGADLGQGEQKGLAVSLSKAYGCAVLVSGRQDAVSDGERTELLAGGDGRIARITGGGCMLSALCALLCGAGIPAYEAALTAGRLWRRSAELAGKAAGGIGSFQAALFDAAEQCFYREMQEERE